jgi:hypothetical protein
MEMLLLFLGALFGGVIIELVHRYRQRWKRNRFGLIPQLAHAERERQAVRAARLMALSYWNTLVDTGVRPRRDLLVIAGHFSCPACDGTGGNLPYEPCRYCNGLGMRPYQYGEESV